MVSGGWRDNIIDNKNKKRKRDQKHGAEKKHGYLPTQFNPTNPPSPPFLPSHPLMTFLPSFQSSPPLCPPP
jgi:hypothetical protein